MDYTKWAICPYCKSKTRVQLLPETAPERFPLFCYKCKKEFVINAKKQEIAVVRQKKSVALATENRNRKRKGEGSSNETEE